ncbi:MAG: YkvA family protein [bacterium]|nr:YkvA family protein [bacterium]
MVRNFLEKKIKDERLRTLLKEGITLVPNLARLAYRLLKDPRVPVRAKLFLGAAVAYTLSPIDVVPDFVPVLGKTDDILVLSLALRYVIEETGMAVVKEHWDGHSQTLDLAVELINAVSDMVPRPLRMVLNRYMRTG